MKVVVVHHRDPDYACVLQVFVDGVEVDAFEYDLDPGRGYDRETWEDSQERDLESARDHGPAVYAAVVAAYEAASESEYVGD